MPIGDGGTRVVGDRVADGTGPADERGEGWRREGEGECSEGEPEERVEALKGWTGLMLGRRIGSGPGADGRSYGKGC